MPAPTGTAATTMGVHRLHRQYCMNCPRCFRSSSSGPLCYHDCSYPSLPLYLPLSLSPPFACIDHSRVSASAAAEASPSAMEVARRPSRGARTIRTTRRWARTDCRTSSCASCMSDTRIAHGLSWRNVGVSGGEEGRRWGVEELRWHSKRWKRGSRSRSRCRRPYWSRVVNVLRN